MKKVLIVAAVFSPEPIVGAGLYSDLAGSLSNDYEVTVIKPKPSRPLGFKFTYTDESKLPFKIISTDSFICPQSSLIGRMKETWSFGKKVSRYIKRNDFDLIYNAAWPLFGQYYVVKAAKNKNIPVISVVQDLYPESISSKLPNIPLLKKTINTILLPIDKFILRNSKAVHTISEKMGKYLSKTRSLDIEKIFIVRNWQDESSFNNIKSETFINNNLFTFMYLGNVGPLSGLETVLEAINLIDKNKYKFRFVIAGSGSAKEYLKNLSGKLKLTNVEFWEVPPGEVANTQAKSDVMILPVKKGFAKSSIPSKLPAYMFSARPIICSVDKDSDTADCVKKAECGWIIEPENPDEMSKSLIKAMETDIQVLTELGGNGRNYALSNFSREENLNKLKKLILSIV